MKLFYALLLTVGVGVIAGFATASNIGNWYAQLAKPPFNPPNWLFGPVWTVLYILMGIALYRIWRQPPSRERTTAMRIFFFQLFLNFCWSFIFFNFHRVGMALIDICLLWIVILVTVLQFSKIDKKAAWLLVPYILWVSFATLLNAAIYHLNGR